MRLMLDGTEASFGGDSAERWALGGVTVQYSTGLLEDTTLSFLRFLHGDKLL